MSKIKTTINKLAEFDKQAAVFLIDNGFLENGKFTKKENTKFSTAIRGILKQYSEKTREFKEDIETININNALENPTDKSLLKDEVSGGFKYSKEGLLKKNKEIKALFNAEFEINQRIVDKSSVPDNLSEEMLEAFDGYVLTNETESE